MLQKAFWYSSNLFVLHNYFDSPTKLLSWSVSN